MTEKTLLLIDDEAMLLRTLQRLLEEDGYRILTATSCADALKLLSDNAIKVIICDQRMPRTVQAGLGLAVGKRIVEMQDGPRSV